MSEVKNTNEYAEDTVTAAEAVDATHAEVAADDHKEVDPGLLGQFGLRPELFAAQLVNFLLVMLVLWRFAYKPIMKMLAERESKIEQSVKDAEEIARRVKESEVAREAAMAEAKAEARAVVEKALADAEARKEEMIEAAKREVERVIVKGKDQMNQEREAMMVELRKDIVDIAVKAAAKIALERIDEKKSQSFAEEVVRKLT